MTTYSELDLVLDQQVPPLKARSILMPNEVRLLEEDPDGRVNLSRALTIWEQEWLQDGATEFGVRAGVSLDQLVVALSQVRATLDNPEYLVKLLAKDVSAIDGGARELVNQSVEVAGHLRSVAAEVNALLAESPEEG